MAEQSSDIPSTLSSEMEAVSIASSSSGAGLQMREEVEKRYQIVRSIGEECIQEDELKNLLSKKAAPICYDGFEPSGRMHIAQGVMKLINVNKLTSAGCRMKIWIADWFAQLNNKMDGDMNKIKVVGEYFIEVWKAAGMNQDKVEFLWSSDEINARADKYWQPLVMDIIRKNKLPRILRCGQIMGRSDSDELSPAQVLYPCMQCADIFFLEADICQLGMDQRKVNMLAREYCDHIKRKNKPIILSHHMLPGLQQGQEKMSKSDPSSAIFMEDDEAAVNVKIKEAYCPLKIVEGNPCLEYIKYITLPWFDEFTVERNEEDGGNKTYKNFEDVAAEYESGELDTGDLKKGLTNALNKILQPVRDHFKNDAHAKNLLKQIKFFMAEQSSYIPSNLSSEMEAVTIASTSLDAGLPMREEVEKRYHIVRSIGEECIQEEELKNLLSKKAAPICYDGFEPSEKMHIAQGLMKVINVNKLTSAGCRVKIWIADCFAFMNNKMGLDLKKIKVFGEYFIEIWKAAGMNEDKVEFLWSSDEINARADKYWPLVMEIACKNTLSVRRCGQIMGRSDSDELSPAQIIYPCMQCADIFSLEADICQLGMDEREVNMLARECCDDIKRKNKPIILPHHMLPGLKQGQEKMSKSVPLSAIFMLDKEIEVNNKIMKAYCLPKIVEGNPCLEYVKYIILPWFDEFSVQRNEIDGGNKIYKNFEDIADEYESGKLHPRHLKKGLMVALNKILQPIRDHFKNDAHAKNLLEQVKAYTVTR